MSKRLGILAFMLISISHFAFSQTRQIKGVVYDETNVELPGANIVVKGTSKGLTTDWDGKFVIDAASGDILEVSFMGYKTKEVKVGDADFYKITLKPDAEALEEVVVTGYQKVDRKLFTGAATKIDMADVKIASEPDISKSLEGQVAGVSVKNVSSTFGTAPKVMVRGASSIYGNQKPLWVVDGVVLEDAVEISMDDISSGNLNTLLSSGVAGLNMDDIQSFQVLKDASATALYGARAMNGVIVITTKKGKKGKLAINYSLNVVAKPVPSYDDYNILNSVDQMEINKELYDKGWINIAKTQLANTQGPYGKLFDYVKRNKIDWATNNDEVNAFLRKYETANTDWFDELFKTGIQQTHTISISGGGEKSTFYTSVGYLHDGGWTIADNVDRYTALLKGTFYISDKFRVTASSNISYRDQQTSGASEAGAVDRFTGRSSRDFDNNPFMYAMGTSRNIRVRDDEGNLEFFRKNYADYNIIDELGKNKTALIVKDMSFNTNFTYDLLSNLSFNAKLSARYYSARTNRLINENSNQANAYRAGTRPGDSENIREVNHLLYEKPGTTTGIKYSILPEGGIFKTVDNSMTNYYLNTNVNWNPKLDEDNMFTFLLGAETRYIDRVTTWADGFGHFFNQGNTSKPSPNYLEKLSMEGSSYYGVSNTYDRFAAFFFNYGYSYKGKYTFNGTFRYDGSNRLGKSSTARWMPTWNFSGKWNIKEEDFLIDNDWINGLSIRATYGLNGSLGAARNAALIAYASPAIRDLHPDQSQMAIKIKELENSDLSWEKQYEFNFGTDFSLFDNRIGGDLNYYKRKGFDLIGDYISNGVGGAHSKRGNVADMDTYGFEAALNFVPVKTTDFRWNMNFNYSYNHTEITSLKSTVWVGQATSLAGVPVQGGPVRGIYSSRFAGLDHKGVPNFYDRDNNKVRYLNVQTDDLSDFAYSGSVDPLTNLGFSNSFSYKHFTLSVLVTGQFGHKKRVMNNYNYSYNDSQALNGNLKNRWRVAGDEKYTNIPAILDADYMNREGSTDIKTAYNLYGMSDFWLIDASFIRMKNISLSYNFPSKTLNKLGMKKLSMSIAATNPFLIWTAEPDKLNGEDPEFVWAGGATMPVTKQYSFSLNIGL